MTYTIKNKPNYFKERADSTSAEKMDLPTDMPVIEASEDLELRIKELSGLRQTLKDLEGLVKEKELAIKTIIGLDNVACVVDRERRKLCTYTRIPFSRLDASALKADQPELYKQYTIKKEYPVLRLVNV